jgi:hypothetical protein
MAMACRHVMMLARRPRTNQHAGHGAWSAARGWVGVPKARAAIPPPVASIGPLSPPARPPISPGSRRVVGLGRHRPASCIPPRMHRWIIASCGDMRLRRRRSTYTVVVVVSLSCSSLYSLEGTIIEKIRTIHGLVWSQTSRRSGRGGRRRLSLRSFGRWRRRGRWPFPGTWRSSGPCRGTGT